jgi:hypothetical protein
MRVILKYNAIPAACGSFTYGQVEDYTVNITATAKLTDANTLNFSLYPNPVKGEVLSIANLDTTATYTIYNLMGQEVSKGTIENNTIMVGALRTGTYLLEVSSEKGTATKRFIKE